MPKATPTTSIVDDHAAIAAAMRQASPTVETDDAPDDDLELLELCEEFHILDAELKAGEMGDAAFTALFKERIAALDDIEEWAATTPAGLRAKAAIGILLIEENHDTRVERLDRDIGFALDVLRDIVDGEE
jgi:hypothetical protein